MWESCRGGNVTGNTGTNLVLSFIAHLAESLNATSKLLCSFKTSKPRCRRFQWRQYHVNFRLLNSMIEKLIIYQAIKNMVFLPLAKSEVSLRLPSTPILWDSHVKSGSSPGIKQRLADFAGLQLTYAVQVKLLFVEDHIITTKSPAETQD